MDVRLHDCRVDSEPLAIFEPKIHRRFYHQIVDGLERLGSQLVKSTMEGVVLRHRSAVELGEAAQGEAVGDPFPQFAIIPTLDAHQDQGT